MVTLFCQYPAVGVHEIAEKRDNLMHYETLKG